MLPQLDESVKRAAKLAKPKPGRIVKEEPLYPILPCSAVYVPTVNVFREDEAHEYAFMSVPTSVSGMWRLSIVSLSLCLSLSFSVSICVLAATSRHPFDRWLCCWRHRW